MIVSHLTLDSIEATRNGSRKTKSLNSGMTMKIHRLAMTTVSGLVAVAAGEVITILPVVVNILISCDCVTLTMDEMSGIVSLSAHILFTVY